MDVASAPWQDAFHLRRRRWMAAVIATSALNVILTISWFVWLLRMPDASTLRDGALLPAWMIAWCVACRLGIAWVLQTAPSEVRQRTQSVRYAHLAMVLVLAAIVTAILLVGEAPMGLRLIRTGLVVVFGEPILSLAFAYADYLRVSVRAHEGADSPQPTSL